jgi:phenylalanyl-tRNA synthetase beta chain
MLLSKHWLTQFVKLPRGVSDSDIASAITNSTVEVERVVDQAKVFENIVVGLVKSVGAHPNADRLKVCQVDVGSCVAQVVCGGANVVAGMKAVVALPGAKVRWHGEGELVELTDTVIRGQKSSGMICASAEIGLPKSPTEGEHDILDLGADDHPAGTQLSKALGRDDVIFEIEHKSLTNRPDLLCHYGMAREVAALLRVPLAKYSVPALRAGKGISLSVEVEDPKLCPRYMAVAVENVKVAPSPEWLRERLNACGVRAINNVVDVTNYVMLELGQPMHAFDADKIGGDGVKIKVRNAKRGEKLECLDEQTYSLDADALLITDGKHPIAIAGVMGGSRTAVEEKTTRIVFESANFLPISVRKTSQKLSLRSESSARFEKAIDPELCPLALARAVELLREICPTANVASAIVDKRARVAKPPTIQLSVQRVNDRLGTNISAKEMKDILTRLGFIVTARKGGFQVRIPSWRATKDVSIFEDLVEEIARLHGYDHIVSQMPSFPITPPRQSRVRDLVRRARHILAATFNALEVYQYAFVSPQTLEALGEDTKKYIRLANPLADDRPLLVRSLIPNLLESVRRNQRVVDEVSLFECERVFLADVSGEETGEGKEFLPGQPLMLAGVFSRKGCEEPFWEVKAMALCVLENIGIKAVLRARGGSSTWQHQGRVAEVVVGDVVVGIVAEVEHAISSAFGLDNRVGAFEINMDVVAGLPVVQTSYKPIASHPCVERDMAFIVDDSLEFAHIHSSVSGASELLREVRLFDVYRGNGVDEGKKSMAIRLVMQADDRTLESREADDVVAKVRDVLEKKFGGMMRA